MNDFNTDTITLKDIYKNPVLRFLLSPGTRIYRHLIFITVLITTFTSGTTVYNKAGDFYIKTAAISFMALLLYLNMYLLVPRFLFRRKYLLYFLSVFLLILLSFFFVNYMQSFLSQYRVMPLKKGNNRLDFSFFAILSGFPLATSTTIKIFQRWVIDSHRIGQLENSRLNAELEQLKSQVNPHFLFNMLNNAHVLTKRDPEKAAHVLLKLSTLLRYQLYDSHRDHVLLSAEIHFVQDFLTLEKTRRDYFEYDIAQEGDVNNLLIPPYLFIIFVENAVKHNADYANQSFVRVSFKREAQRLTFECINSKPATIVASKKPGGLGLLNVRRRLELLYPGTHTLITEENKDIYHVKLILPI